MWYHIRALDMDIDKPNGMMIEFWLSADSRKELDKLLKTKHYITEIEWIKQEKPPFEE